MKIRASLYFMTGAGLIIPANTDCVYFNQVGGTMCYQPEMEGIFIPVNFDCDPNNFEESLEYKLGLLFSDIETVDQKKAKAIDNLLSRRMETHGISVDYQKLEKSRESWIYVDIKQTEYNPFECEDELKGVLTWPNSD